MYLTKSLILLIFQYLFIHDYKFLLWYRLDSLDVLKSVGTVRIHQKSFIVVGDSLMQGQILWATYITL